jgi:hypothetical protein
MKHVLIACPLNNKRGAHSKHASKGQAATAGPSWALACQPQQRALDQPQVQRSQRDAPNHLAPSDNASRANVEHAADVAVVSQLQLVCALTTAALLALLCVPGWPRRAHALEAPRTPQHDKCKRACGQPRSMEVACRCLGSISGAFGRHHRARQNGPTQTLQQISCAPPHVL